MKIVFGNQENLLWLWLVLPLIITFYFIYKIKIKKLKTFLGDDYNKFLTFPVSKNILNIKAVLIILSVIFIVLALARPRWGFEWKTIKRRGVDIMIAIDVSQSMLAQDIKPSRLERAKREITDLLKMLQGDRIGLIAFAGTGFVLCPLTADYNAVKMFLDYLDPSLIPVPGTAIGEAINLADKSLKEASPEESRGKYLIVITDGEDLNSSPISAAKIADKDGIKIFTIGIGSLAGAPIPSSNGGFKKDYSGKVVISKLGENTLVDIAKQTGGFYVRSITGNLDLDRIYHQGIKKELKDKDVHSFRKKVWYERFQWFALIAFILLLIEFFLAPRKNSASSLITLLLIFAFTYTPHIYAMSLKDSYKAFNKGDYDKAAKGFSEAEIDDPDNLEYSYNRAVSQYKAKNYEEAKQGFLKSSKSPDKDLSFKSLFNLGNSKALSKDLNGAVDAYNKALKIRPDDQDTKANLQYVKKLLKQQKKQQQKNDKNKKNKNNKDNQKNNKNQNNDQKNQNDSQKNKKLENKKEGQKNKSDKNNEKQQQNMQKKEGKQKQQQAEAGKKGKKNSQEMTRQNAAIILNGVEDKISKYIFRPTAKDLQKAEKAKRSGRDW